MNSHGIDPTVWIAPAHSFDKNTLIALKLETNIRIISDGFVLPCFHLRMKVFYGFHNSFGGLEKDPLVFGRYVYIPIRWMKKLSHLF